MTHPAHSPSLDKHDSNYLSLQIVSLCLDDLVLKEYGSPLLLAFSAVGQ